MSGSPPVIGIHVSPEACAPGSTPTPFELRRLSGFMVAVSVTVVLLPVELTVVDWDLVVVTVCAWPDSGSVTVFVEVDSSMIAGASG